MALVDDREIRRVHREFLGEDTPTDVISFLYEPPPGPARADGAPEGGKRRRQARGERRGPGRPARPGRRGRTGRALEGEPFGELVISAETALREARRRRIRPGEELLRYAVHGLLHLLGHDDRDPAGRRRMRALERRWLREAMGP